MSLKAYERGTAPRASRHAGPGLHARRPHSVGDGCGSCRHRLYCPRSASALTRSSPVVLRPEAGGTAAGCRTATTATTSSDRSPSLMPRSPGTLAGRCAMSRLPSTVERASSTLVAARRRVCATCPGTALWPLAQTSRGRWPWRAVRSWRWPSRSLGSGAPAGMVCQGQSGAGYRPPTASLGTRRARRWAARLPEDGYGRLSHAGAPVAAPGPMRSRWAPDPAAIRWPGQSLLRGFQYTGHPSGRGADRPQASTEAGNRERISPVAARS